MFSFRFFLLVSLNTLLTAVEGFGQPRIQVPKYETALHNNMVGNFFSGLTGVPPATLLLEPLQQQLTSGTSLQDVDLTCAYKASRDGWSAVDFHEKVDGRGSCLVVALARGSGGALFGGFNPLGWMSTDDYTASNAAFLWFQKGNNNGVKCPILSGGNAAVFDYATGGPNFGAADLVIGPPQAAVMGGFTGPDMMDTKINAGNLKEGSSSPGSAYNIPNGWPVRGAFRLTEVEVYCNANVKQQWSSSSGSSWWPF